MNGGYLATFSAMAVTYVTGMAFSVTGWLGDAWTHLTPGQAALIIGLLTYGTHNGSKLFKLPGVRRLGIKLCARLEGMLRGPEADGKREFLFFTALTLAVFLAGVGVLALIFHVSP
ncbi:MAG TPA: hypothetical protein VHU19_14310 [Pyrinomonadaceae bacterium]|nr:hypothetical protein [Pyrinomonadaceae bacterium]